MSCLEFLESTSDTMFKMYLLKRCFLSLFFHFTIISIYWTEIKVQNATGEVGEGGKQISCSVTNHKNWTYFNIERNGQTVVHVSPDGRVQTRFNQKYLSITPTIRENLAEINISFASLRCSDEGLYRCVIDGREQPQNIAVVVKCKYLSKCKHRTIMILKQYHINESVLCSKLFKWSGSICLDEHDKWGTSAIIYSSMIAMLFIIYTSIQDLPRFLYWLK